jgi:hypothetical protein
MLLAPWSMVSITDIQLKKYKQKQYKFFACVKQPRLILFSLLFNFKTFIDFFETISYKVKRKKLGNFWSVCLFICLFVWRISFLFRFPFLLSFYFVQWITIFFFNWLITIFKFQRNIITIDKNRDRSFDRITFFRN